MYTFMYTAVQPDFARPKTHSKILHVQARLYLHTLISVHDPSIPYAVTVTTMHVHR